MKRTVHKAICAVMCALLLCAAASAWPSRAQAASVEAWVLASSITLGDIQDNGSVMVNFIIEGRNTTGVEITDVKVTLDSGTQIAAWDKVVPGAFSQKVNYLVPVNMQGQNIPFKLEWLQDGERGNPITFSFAAPKADPVLAVDFKRTADKTMAAEGDKVTFRYTVKNNSNVKILDVVIADDLFGTVNTPVTLEKGKEMTFEKTHTVTGDSASRPRLTYRGGGKTGEESLPELKITMASNQLQVAITGDKAVIKDGEALVISCIVTNNGNVPLSNLVMTESLLGQVQQKEALEPGKTWTFTHKVDDLKETHEFIFEVTAQNSVGQTVTAKSAALSVTRETTMRLALTVTPETTEIPQGGKVWFTFKLVNESAVIAEKIMIIERNKLGQIEKDITVEGGKDMTFRKELEISEAMRLDFMAEVTDKAGQPLQFSANPIEMKTGLATLEPSPSAAPGGGVMTTIWTVLGVIAFLALASGAVLFILVWQDKKKKAASAAKAGRPGVGAVRRDEMGRPVGVMPGESDVRTFVRPEDGAEGQTAAGAVSQRTQPVQRIPRTLVEELVGGEKTVVVPRVRTAETPPRMEIPKQEEKPDEEDKYDPSM